MNASRNTVKVPAVSIQRSDPSPQPTITVFSGPNGSGKTSITNQMVREMDVGELVNADQIAAGLAHAAGLDVATTEMQFQAAHEAERRRWTMMMERDSFCTETVMSDRERWATFFNLARQAGYSLQMVFISTRDPAINIGRVAQRVRKGGHHVDAEKIVARYHKTHAFLREALSLMDVAFIYDNSDPDTAGGPVLLITLSPDDGLKAQVPVEDMPAWAAQLLNPASR